MKSNPEREQRSYKGNYIQGQFQKASDPNGEILSKNPGDLTQPPISFPYNYEHVQSALGAARIAFASWRQKNVSDRANSMVRYRDTLLQRKEELARLISLETGKPLWESRVEITDTGALIDEFLGLVKEKTLEVKVRERKESADVIRFIPRGVMTVISPANQPLLGSHAHLVPVLLYGNVLILKASKSAPMVGQAIAECAHEAGMPAGVFQMLQGDAEVARRLASSSGIDGVFFTGSHETGMKIQKQLVSETWKMLVLEMGGKNGTVIWEDAHYEKALQHAFYSSYVTTGQRYSSTSRILIHEKFFDRFAQDFHAMSKKCKVGYGLSEGNDSPLMGPLLNEASMESYIRYQGMAVREGCEELMRGKQLEREKKGYYVSPSIHIVPAVDPKSVYQRNEVYGPNVALYKVSDLDEVTSILNLPQHSLVASVYTQSREIYLRILEDSRVGMIHWNAPTTTRHYQLPISAIQKSGNNRPMGSFSLHQCTYPMSCLEFSSAPEAIEIPKEMPRLD